jgi:galactokinase
VEKSICRKETHARLSSLQNIKDIIIKLGTPTPKLLGFRFRYFEANSEMSNAQTSFISIAPGRVCLFGEHQDYLHLPVIAFALPLSCEIHVTPTPAIRRLILKFEQRVWDINLDEIPPKQGKRLNDDTNEMDFVLAGIHEFLDAGWIFQRGGAICESTTDLPVQAGVSSSSAFCVAWVQVLLQCMDKPHSTQEQITPIEIAKWAHQVEVTHFGSPGGTMDHVTSALGGILRIGPEMWDYKKLDIPSGGYWVLADSGEPKDTLKHLNRCKFERLKLLEKLDGDWDNKSTSDKNLTDDEISLLQATIINRDTEQQAAGEWSTSSAKVLASYMAKHHEALRDGLHLSTPRLEAMNEAAIEAGAWAFKVVGSGGGGCGVAWCSANHDVATLVAEAMKRAGAKNTWIITESSEGSSVKFL